MDGRGILHAHLRLLTGGAHHAVEEVAHADEARDKGVFGVGIYLLGCADLHDVTGLHDGNAVGDGERLLLVVGDVDGRDTKAALELFDDGAHLHTQLGIEVGERLVHQKHARLDDKGTRQRDALLLTAGEVARLALGEVGDLHQLKRLLHTLLYLRLGDLPRLETVGHILRDGQMGEDGVVLEDHADVALMRRYVVDTPVAEVEVAALDGVEAGDHAEQGRLAAAGGTEQGEEFSLMDGDGNAVKRCKISVTLDRVADDDLVAHKSSSLAACADMVIAMLMIESKQAA